jgi:hypothetical protein
MVIQGQRAQVGSREKEVRSSILSIGQQPQASSLTTTLKAPTEGSNVREFSYEIKGKTTEITLQMALVETHVANDVPRGENSGHRLTHTNVVRTLTSQINPKLQGTLAIDISVLETSSKGKVILFVQDTEQMTVLGVTEIVL